MSLKNSKIVVIKIGSSLLVDENKKVRKKWLSSFAKDIITSALSKQETVSLVGFGTFAVKHRAAREGRNPRTGDTIQIAASNAPSFKAGKALKDACN